MKVSIFAGARLAAVLLSALAWPVVANAAGACLHEICGPSSDAVTPGCSERPLASSHQHEIAAAEAVKAREHMAALDLVRLCEVTDTAAQSGSWSDARTWRVGRVPGPDAKVHIPKDVAVDVDTVLDAVPLEWIRVDGRLNFRTNVDTALAVRTLVVTPDGRLEIGTPAMPLRSDAHARIVFVPRTSRNREGDPYDLAGGLVSQGVVQMIAARKTAHAASTTRLVRGTDRLDFGEPMDGWRIGDRILVPGTAEVEDQDEVRTIAAIGDGGRTVALDHALKFDHFAPTGVSIPIANLTRNIELRSLAADPLAARAHVVIMHVQTGTVFDGVAFLHLGRTDTRFAHTFPKIGADGTTIPGTDANTIGRYAVHFHVLSGALTSVPPHLVRNCVVIDSPKYGIVNHGGHVVAEDNVTFRIAGAHFVAENGSEIGAFRRNVAVRSTGSGEYLLENRMSVYDFGHGGHGFWLQSGAIALADNWASGHARAGIFSMGMPFREGGREIFFDARNTDNREYADEHGRIASSDVDFRFTHNTVAASGLGLEIWYHKLYSSFRERSLVDGLTVWNVADAAVSVLYTRNVALKNVRLLGSGRPGTLGIESNALTESILLEDSEVRGFALGMRVPERGQNVIRNANLDNDVNLKVPLALVKGRRIHIDRVTFASDGRPGAVNVLLGNSSDGADIPVDGLNVRFADLALLFADDRIDLTDQGGRNYRLFFPFQLPGAVMFASTGPVAMRGLSSGEIYRRYGLAPGGVIAPEDAVELPRSNALAAPAPLPVIDSGRITEGSAESYPLQTQHFVTPASHEGADHWAILMSKGNERSVVSYANTTPAKFMLRRGLLPLTIHPDDVQFGYRVAGVILERVEQKLSLRTFEREFYELKIDSDGFVRIAFNYPDLAGAEIPYELALRVSPDAVRRGSNVDFFFQRAFCGICGRDTLEADAELYFQTGELDPLVQFAGTCERLQSSAIPLSRPFIKEQGYAYVAPRPELKEMSDNMTMPRRSPFSLCENGLNVGPAHTSHQEIRRAGHGDFSHWGENIYFSSSDGSDPNTNGYQYSLVRPQN